MNVTIELTDAQELALDKLNVKTAKDVAEFVEAGAANKIKGSVSSALKSFAKSALPTYNRLPKEMQKVMSADAFLTIGAQEMYDVLVSLGGREVKPLPELLADIINNDNE